MKEQENQIKENSESQLEKSSPKKLKQFNSYIRYSALGFQMIGTILLMAWLGTYIDEKADTKTPIYTLLFMLIGVSGSIYLLIRDVTKRN